ncbi:thioredoxin domain-containing protein 11 [Ditylenchus destructor]|nr:thioredoxin domain-containing protein 11 [Ditylenchus destructor]
MTDINSYDSAAAPSTSQTNDIQNSICEKSVKRTHCYSSNATFSHSRNNSEISNSAYDYIEDFVDEQIHLAYFDATHQFGTFAKHRYSVKSPDLASQSWISYILKKITMPRALTFMIICWSISSLIKYAIFSDGPLPTREAPVPTPFFANTSGVLQDYYRGERAEKSLLVSRAEITVQMFYAPWSLHSMEARQPFLDVATSFRDFRPAIKFVAINCNDHRGQCKRIYRLYSYPVIFAYVMGGIPIVFNHPVTTDRLFSWVSHLLHPTRKLQTINDFYSIVELYDYAVVGYLPFNEPATSRPFKVFLASAYKAAAMRGSVGFASIQNAKLANLLGFDESNELRFYSSHGNDDPLHSFTSFTIAKVTKSIDVMKWIQENIGEVAYRTVEHLNLEDDEYGGKSESLYRKLNSSTATVVLFTDYYAIPYFSQSQVMLRQLANDFNNCTPLDNSDNIGYDKVEQHTTKTYFDVAKQACAMQHPRNTDVSNCCKDLIRSHYCTNKLSSTSTNKATTSNTSSCLSVEKIFNKELFHRKCCNYHRQRGKVDTFAITLPWNLKVTCQYLRLLRKTQPSSLLRQLDVAFSTPNIIRLACHVNQTIGFLVLDKRFAQYFVQSWDGPEHSLENKDALAIVSNPNERIHWLDKEINKKDVESFLLDFVQIKIRDEYNTPSMNEIQSHARNISIAYENKILAMNNHSVIQKLSAVNFANNILKKRNSFDAVVFFSGGRSHGPSQVLAYVLHTAKRYFHQFDYLIEFFSLDASKRPLPWEYTFDTLPTVVFFPAYRPSESSAFPRNLPLTVPNLMAFILSRAQPELRWRLAITACTPECLQKNMQQMDRFIHHLDDDIRLLRRLLRRFTTPPRIHLRTLLRRRYLQRRCAIHLEKMLSLFEQARHINTVKKISEERFINDTMFMKWLLSNRFGLTYTS